MYQTYIIFVRVSNRMENRSVHSNNYQLGFYYHPRTRPQVSEQILRCVSSRKHEIIQSSCHHIFMIDGIKSFIASAIHSSYACTNFQANLKLCLAVCRLFHIIFIYTSSSEGVKHTESIYIEGLNPCQKLRLTDHASVYY